MVLAKEIIKAIFVGALLGLLFAFVLMGTSHYFGNFFMDKQANEILDKVAEGILAKNNSISDSAKDAYVWVIENKAHDFYFKQNCLNCSRLERKKYFLNKYFGGWRLFTLEGIGSCGDRAQTLEHLLRKMNITVSFVQMMGADHAWVEFLSEEGTWIMINPSSINFEVFWDNYTFFRNEGYVVSRVVANRNGLCEDITERYFPETNVSIELNNNFKMPYVPTTLMVLNRQLSIFDPSRYKSPRFSGIAQSTGNTFNFSLGYLNQTVFYVWSCNSLFCNWGSEIINSESVSGQIQIKMQIVPKGFPFYKILFDADSTALNVMTSMKLRNCYEIPLLS